MGHINYFIDWALYDIKFKILALILPIPCIPNIRQGLFVKNDFEIKGHMFLTIFNDWKHILSGYDDLYFENIGPAASTRWSAHIPRAEDPFPAQQIFRYAIPDDTSWRDPRSGWIFKFLVIKQFALGRIFLIKNFIETPRLKKPHITVCNR